MGSSKAEQRERIDEARELMARYRARTGSEGGAEGARRYLWTDAFAVCNLLELHRRSESDAYLRSALSLVDEVHETLGRHRPDDPRSGWISGLDEEEGRAHPTRGGLRIGKRHNERAPDEPFDAQQEWDRDGQYFHYLTKWMHALARVGGVTGEARYIRQATELGSAAYAGFALPTRSGGTGLCWKMSIDLSRPLVPTAGHHDPLDGLITFLELQAASSGPPDVLQAEVAGLGSMCEGAEWTTADPLGLGGLLCDAYRLARLIVGGSSDATGLLTDLLRSSALGLGVLEQQNGLAGPSAHRLAFRELGLSIGLQAVPRLERLRERSSALPGYASPAGRYLDELHRFVPAAERILEFWLEPENRAGSAWNEHLDINTVMLATGLAPDGFLSL